MRKAAIVCTLGLLFYWLPADIESIRFGLESEPKLALGISLKIFMHVMAAIGLGLDKTFGYVFLLGATVQGLVVSTSAMRALPFESWWQYKGQLMGPAVDIILRCLCVVFLASRPSELKEARE